MRTPFERGQVAVEAQVHHVVEEREPAVRSIGPAAEELVQDALVAACVQHRQTIIGITVSMRVVTCNMQVRTS